MEVNSLLINSAEDITLIMSSFSEKITSLTQELEFTRKNYTQARNQFIQNQKAFEIEIDSIKAQLNEYQSIIASQATKLTQLEKELDIFKHPHNSIVEGFPIINQKGIEDNINLLIELKSFEVQLKKTDRNNLNALINDFDLFKLNINTLITEKNTEIDLLAKGNKELEEQNKALRQKLQESEKENDSNKFCTQCHNDFIPKFNNEKSCIFHPGKLQYYSCRGCGEDEYYTCCNKCSRCSKGCKVAKHLFS